jgi:hypothetical protein
MWSANRGALELVAADSIFKQLKTISKTTPRSRGAMRPSFARTLRPEKPEGVGNAGCPLHPQPRVQSGKHTGGSHRSTGTPGIPARNGFNGLFRALPGDEFVLSPSSAD